MNKGMSTASRCFSRCFSVQKNVTARSATPLIQSFRASWPQPLLSKGQDVELPKRTVPDSVLRFQLKATFDHGTAILYPHLDYNPADYKIVMFVKLSDLGLDKNEAEVMKALVDRRYNHGRDEIKLTFEKFKNRMENKKYVIYTLENLIIEAKRLAAEAVNYKE